MPQSLSMNLVHLIYSTKNRDASLTPAIRPKLYAYQAGILQEWNSPAIVIDGVADHVHALFMLSKNYALCKVLEEVKKGSSNWIKTQGEAFATFCWQNGYGAFSVSESQVECVRRHIEQQEEHHRTMTFQEEFRKFSGRHRLDLDERYVWD